jgi:CRISPR-associated endoribonuclease Cas6
MRVDRLLLTEALKQVRVSFCDLRVEQFHYIHSIQKGFVGTCHYLLPTDHQFTPFLANLAAFAYYAGIGYKTTMGMGQTDSIQKDTMKGAETT